MKYIKVFLQVTIPLFLLIGCSQPKAEVLPTYTPYPTLAPLPTYTLYPTLEPLPTYTSYPTMVMPTAVPTATVPAVTDTPEPTVNPDLTSDKAEGIWLVGKEVAVGLWRASGDCYAVTYDKSGKEMNMADGRNSIISIPSDAFSVKFVSYPDHCKWSYLGK
jgi:hypothetical protein